jgi:hypothetical protein
MVSASVLKNRDGFLIGFYEIGPNRFSMISRSSREVPGKFLESLLQSAGIDLD